MWHCSACGQTGAVADEEYNGEFRYAPQNELYKKLIKLREGRFESKRKKEQRKKKGK